MPFRRILQLLHTSTCAMLYRQRPLHHHSNGSTGNVALQMQMHAEWSFCDRSGRSFGASPVDLIHTVVIKKISQSFSMRGQLDLGSPHLRTAKHRCGLSSCHQPQTWHRWSWYVAIHGQGVATAMCMLRIVEQVQIRIGCRHRLGVRQFCETSSNGKVHLYMV